MGGEITVPYKRLGAWLARAHSTVYQASTDGIVHAYALSDVASEGLQGMTDAANPPLTGRAYATSPSGYYSYINFEVKKNDFWEVNLVNTPTPIAVYWIPSEP